MDRDSWEILKTRWGSPDLGHFCQVIQEMFVESAYSWASPGVIPPPPKKKKKKSAYFTRLWYVQSVSDNIVLPLAQSLSVTITLGCFDSLFNVHYVSDIYP